MLTVSQKELQWTCVWELCLKHASLLYNLVISSAKEYCKVTFAFEATNEDELSLKEGEIIHILSKVPFRCCRHWSCEIKSSHWVRAQDTHSVSAVSPVNLTQSRKEAVSHISWTNLLDGLCSLAVLQNSFLSLSNNPDGMSQLSQTVSICYSVAQACFQPPPPKKKYNTIQIDIKISTLMLVFLD